MLVYAALAAVLPLALACPCPPAPAATEVCGSDLVTYPSLCHLQCAAVPGLSLKHPGPCSPEDAVGAAQQTGGRDHPQRRHSPTEERLKWEECEREQCVAATGCGCGKDEDDCVRMCKKDCNCGCGGYPRGGMDWGLWAECYGERRCMETYPQCLDGCGGELQCQDKCALDDNKCDCDCVQRAQPASKRKHNWETCLVQRQCVYKTCSECRGAADRLCARRCSRRCECECAGYPGRDSSGEWEECFIGTQSCEEAHRVCAKECHGQECRDAFDLALVDCSCECRSATEAEWRLWGECKMERECESKTCSECRKGDTDCKERCQRNCGCGCLGIPADILDDVPLHQCKIDNECETKRRNCLDHCDTAKDKECEHSCNLDSEKCHCECARSRSESKRVEIIQHCNFIS